MNTTRVTLSMHWKDPSSDLLLEVRLNSSSASGQIALGGDRSDSYLTRLNNEMSRLRTERGEKYGRNICTLPRELHSVVRVTIRKVSSTKLNEAVVTTTKRACCKIF